MEIVWNKKPESTFQKFKDEKTIIISIRLSNYPLKNEKLESIFQIIHVVRIV